MPLPEKEYFALEEIEERWNIRRVDTVYYAENAQLKIAARVVGVVIETGIIETEPDGRWYRLPEEHRRYSGLLTLRACDLALVFRRGSASISFFDPGENRYGDIAQPEDGIEVRVCDLVVTRAERDRFEQTHALGERVKSNGSPAIPAMLPIDCGDDGGWITVHGRVYEFSGLLQKTAIRRLYEAWESGAPRLNMQALLEDIESGSRHISQVFGAGNRSWREIVGYSRGYVWLKADG
jgi:hypothetical protein